MLPNTESRDCDQVVYRNRKKALSREKDFYTMGRFERQKRIKSMKILMVDQVWIWFIPGRKALQPDPTGRGSQPDTIITSFPQRWCQQDHNDPDLFDSMRNFEGKPPLISSFFGLLDLISSKCTHIFDPSVAAEDGKFLEYFESEIGEAVCVSLRPSGLDADLSSLIKSQAFSRTLAKTQLISTTAIRKPRILVGQIF